MKKLCFFLCLLTGVNLSSFAQNIGIGTNAPDPSAKLEIADISKGILIPRIDSLNRMNIQNPATGLLVYETNTNLF